MGRFPHQGESQSQDRLQPEEATAGSSIGSGRGSWGTGPDGERAPNPEEEKVSDSVLHEQLAESKQKEKDAIEDRNSLRRELASAKAEARKAKEELQEHKYRSRPENKMSEYGVREGIVRAIEERSDGAINSQFTEILAEHARKAIENPTVEAIAKIPDRATCEIVLEELRIRGALNKELTDDALQKIANMSEEDRRFMLNTLKDVGALDSKKNKELRGLWRENTDIDLVRNTPTEGVDRRIFESTQDTYVHTVDKEEISGLLSATLGNIDSSFKMGLDAKERIWITGKLKTLIMNEKKRNVTDKKTSELFERMGLKGENIFDLYSGQRVNLLPVLADQTIMEEMITIAGREKKEIDEKDVEGKQKFEHIIKVLERVHAKAKESRTALG